MGMVEEALDAISEFADSLKLEGEDREDFINSAMKRRGFTQVSSWSEPEPENNGNAEGDFFSRQRAQRTQEKSNQTRRIPTKSSRDSGMYGY